MKNLKKLLSVALSLAILLTLAVPALAAEMTAAEKVELLGILQGEGNGVDDAYLSKATTRVQGAILLLRLVGKEDEAAAYAGEDNFADVVGNEWFTPYLAYVKANPSVGFIGYPDGTFQPRKLMTGAELYKVLLTVLGYKQDVDYTWAEVAEKAEELGMIAIENPSAAIKNADMADAILEALQAEMKDGVALVDHLIAEGIITAADANAAGLITTLAIVSAVPTNADELTVTFNKPVEGTPSITVKSGYMNVFVSKAWNDAKTQLVLKKSNNFSAGTYEVTVGELKASVKFEKEVAAQVAIAQATALINATPEIEVLLYNQYGKKMSVSGQNFSATAFNKTTGSTLLVTPLGGAKFQINTGSVKENEIITVTAMHHQSTIVGQADLTAVTANKVTQFAMTEVVLPKDAARITKTDKDVAIKYEAYNQYGNAMKLTSISSVNATSSGLTFISSNENVLEVSKLKFDSDGKLIISEFKGSGAVTLSVLVNSAAVVTSLPITVYDPVAVNKVVIGDPLKEVVEGETTEISFVALDQFGNELDKTKADFSKLSFKPVVPEGVTFVNGNFTMDKGVLKVTPPVGSKGYVTVYYYLDNVLIGSFSLDVWAKAVPTAIEGVTYAGGIELGATQSIGEKAIKVVDQYGRVYDADKTAMSTDNFTWTSNPATGGVIGVATPNGDKNAWSFVASDKEGAVTYTVQLQYVNDKGETVVRPDSAYAFTLKAIDVDKAENGVTYKFASIPTLYSNAAFTDKATAGSYAKEVTLIGTTSDGTTVTLKSGKIYQLTSSNANVKVKQEENKWFVYSANKDAQTSKLRAYDITGKLLCDADVSATATRSAQSVAFSSSYEMATGASIDLSTSYAALGFKVNDEYGVNMLTTTTPPAFNLATGGFFATSDSNVIKVNADGKTIEAVNAGTATLTYVTNTGLKASIKVTVE